MFEPDTEGAGRAMFFGRFEAGDVGSPGIDPEHLLLGLFRADRSVALVMLGTGEAIKSTRRNLFASLPRGETVPAAAGMRVKPACARVLGFAAEEADEFGHKNIPSGHLFLGLLREEDCLAVRLLKANGLTLASARAIVPNRLGPPPV